MKRIFAVVVAALAFATPLAHAQSPVVDPRAVAAVKDLLETMKYREMIVQTNAQMANQLPEMLRSYAAEAVRAEANMTDEQRQKAMATIDEKMPEVVAAVRELMDDPKLIDEMLNAMPALYARHFTVAEIQEMGRFYKTPLGAKTLKVMPQLMAESMQLGQQLVAPRLQALSERIMKSMGVKQPGQ